MSFFRSFGRNWFDFGKHGVTFNLGEDSLSGNERNCLFRNDGGTFSEVAWVTGVASPLDGRGFTYADFDRDGDLDFVVLNDGQELQYFDNQHPSPGHWLTIQLRSDLGNALAIGARIELEVDGQRMTREIHTGSGFLSSPPPEAHFGLAGSTRADRVTVRWPSGRVQVLEDVEGDRVLLLEEPERSPPPRQ